MVKKADAKRACSVAALSRRATEAALAADPVLALSDFVSQPPPVQPASPPMTKLPSLLKLQAAVHSQAQELAEDSNRADFSFEAETLGPPDRMMFGLFLPEREDADSTAVVVQHVGTSFSQHVGTSFSQPDGSSPPRHECLAGSAGLSLRKPSCDRRGRGTHGSSSAATPRREPSAVGQREGHDTGKTSVVPVAPSAPPGPPPQQKPRRLRRSA